MKKNFTLFAAAAVALSLGLSSCDKDTAEALNVDTSRTATVRGTIMVKSDISVAEHLQVFAPAQIEAKDIIATLDNSKFASGATGKYTVSEENITYDAATGAYTIVTPTNVAGDAELTVDVSFVGSLKSKENGVEKDTEVIWKKTTADKTAGLRENSINALLITFDGNNASDFTPASYTDANGLNLSHTATIKGKIMVQADVNSPGGVTAWTPAGITAEHIMIGVKRSELGDTEAATKDKSYYVPASQITYNADGTYEAKVPVKADGTDTEVTVDVKPFAGTVTGKRQKVTMNEDGELELLAEPMEPISGEWGSKVTTKKILSLKESAIADVANFLYKTDNFKTEVANDTVYVNGSITLVATVLADASLSGGAENLPFPNNAEVDAYVTHTGTMPEYVVDNNDEDNTPEGYGEFVLPDDAVEVFAEGLIAINNVPLADNHSSAGTKVTLRIRPRASFNPNGDAGVFKFTFTIPSTVEGEYYNDRKVTAEHVLTGADFDKDED